MTSSDRSAALRLAQQITDRAMTDPDFRSRLRSDPREAVQQELGVTIPGSVNVRVVEEQPGEVVLVLPAPAMESGAALSDEDLERAAGGIDITIYDTCSLGGTSGSSCVC